MIEVERVKHMSVEEAIEVLAQDLPCETDEDLSEAMTMAIKALEQQPCEDAVSRQAVHNLIAELLSDYLHDEDREKIEELDVKIEDLPSVTPKEKTAAWVPTDEEPHEDYECNKCGYAISTFTANIEPHTEYKYCPNCGARMVSE